MALTLKDRDIKNAIGDLIDQALAELYVGANPPVNVKVLRRWTLSHNLGESSALLKATSGADVGKVHAWMIGAGSVKRIRPLRGGESYLGLAANGSLKITGPDLRYVIKSYRVWAYLQYRIGDDDDNSENTLMDEIEYVSNHVSKYPLLGLSGHEVKGHTELSFDTIDTFKFGEIQANVAQGQIDVYLYDTVSNTP